MRRLLLASVFALTFAKMAGAQTDPLNAAFKPVIDTTCTDYLANAWLTDWNAKVRQDAGTAPACTNGSTAVGMKWLTIYATQNEFADFQVHFHDTGSGTANLSVTASNFVKNTGPGGTFTISSATGVGEDIIVYREAYMFVSKVTATAAAYYNATGTYPDILIPPVDPYWGQTTNAWPFTVAAGKNQSAWVDVQIPPNAPSGWYSGTVTIKSGATTLVTMPVVIGVWQWPAAQGGQMPSTPTLRTNISEFQDNALCYAAYLGPTTGSPPPYQTACGAYQDSGGNYGTAQNLTSIDASIMFKDHRYDIGGRQKNYPGSGPYTSYNSTVGVLMTGACAHSGAYCPLLAGSKNTSTQIAKLGPGTTQQQFQGWAGNFNTSGWAAYPPSGTQTSTNPVTRLFDYAADEPAGNCTNWNSGSAAHAFATPAYMPELVTGTLTQANACSALQNVDILVANLKLTQSPLNPTIEPQQPYFDWIAGTNPTNPAGQHREYWSYQACDQTGTCGNSSTGNSTWTMPNVNIDGVPAANRAEEWMTFLHKQTGELYFDPAYCLEPTQLTGCGLPQSNDPWLNNLAFGGSGEGSLMQVGQGTNAAATNYMGAGVVNAKPIFLPTIRLKHWRDGVQDYEYLNALTVAGQGTFVNTQVSNWITNTFTFDLTGSGLNTARFNVGQAIHALTFSGGGFPWSGILAPSRATDWSNAGVLDPFTLKSEANGGGIPNYTTLATGFTNPIPAYGLPNNSGKVTASGATMTVTSVTTGTSVVAAWGTAPGNLVSITEPVTSGTYAGQGCSPSCVYTITSGDPINATSSEWVGRTFTIVHSGTAAFAVVSAISPTQVTFATQPKSIGGALIPDGAATSTTAQSVSATISSATPPPGGGTFGTFTLSATPTIPVGGYTLAGAGDVTAINNALASCSSQSSPGNGHVVQLGPGSFNLLVSPNMIGIHDCVLRGTNPNLSTLTEGTIINYITAGSKCGGFPAGICFADVSAGGGTTVGAYPVTNAGLLQNGAAATTNSGNGSSPGTGVNDATWTGAATTSTVVAGTYTTGSTWITLTNVGNSGGGIHNGQPLTLDVEDGFLVSAAGYEFCTRLGYGNYPPTSCNQEFPFGARSGRVRGTATLAGNALTWVSGSQFTTPVGSLVNATILINGGPYNIGAVTDTTHLTLLARSSGAGPQTSGGACTPSGTTYLDTNSGGLFWVCASPSDPVNGTWVAVNPGTYPFSFGYRGQTQVVTVVSDPAASACLATGCTGAGPFTVRISDPLIGQNWSSSLIPAAWFPVGNVTKNSGVEDLTIDQAINTDITATSVGFVSVTNNWAKGIRSLHGDRSHFALLYSDHVSILNNYCYGTKGSSTQSYCIEQDSSSHVLFENNICQQIVACMISDGDAGSVFAYNYGTDNFVSNFVTPKTLTQVSSTATTGTYTYTGGAVGNVGFTPASVAGVPASVGSFFNITNLQYTSDTGTAFTVTLPCSPSCPVVAPTAVTGALLHISNSVMSATFIPHSDGNRYMLVEGNIGNQFHCDTIHGPSCRAITANRNYFGGNEKNISQQLVPVRIESLQRYNNFIGNVLGSTVTQGYNNYPGCASGCTGSNWAYSWITGGVGESTNTIDPDPLGQSTTMRWGNSALVSGTTTTNFLSSEVPTGDTFGYANSVPASQTLPASFWRGSAPSFFVTNYGTVPFPPIGPDVAGGNALAPDMTGTRTPPGGHAFDNAASLAWQNLPIDPNYVGFDGGVRLFSESVYGSAAIPTTTLSPSPLAFGNQNINTTSAGLAATLTNTGTVPVVVTQSQTFGTSYTLTNLGSCFTTFGSNTSFTLPVGQSCTFVITFTPTVVGANTGTFQVTDNAAGSPQVINLTGTGTAPAIAWSSPQGGTTYNFGTVNIGTPVSSPGGAPCTTTPANCIELTNTGTGPLNVALTITGTNPAQFSITSTTCPNPLPAGASCTATVTFTPTAAVSYTAFLTETDSVQSLTANVTLNGAGQTPPVNIVAPWPVIIMSKNRSPRYEISDDSCSVLSLGWCVAGAKPSSRLVVDSKPFYWGDGL